MFFDKLQEVCDEKGVAMSALLDQLDMSRGNIARWKSGKAPKAATQIKIAAALGVDRSRLIGDIACGEPITVEQKKESSPTANAVEEQIAKEAANLSQADQQTVLEYIRFLKSKQ